MAERAFESPEEFLVKVRTLVYAAQKSLDR
jgi:hypothetical protein